MYSLNLFPRSSKLEKASKLVEAGESSTVSPRLAILIAVITAEKRVSQSIIRSRSAVTPPTVAAISSRFSPQIIIAPEVCRSGGISGA